jgi:uncharacterized protein YggL (DUF469 family)
MKKRLRKKKHVGEFTEWGRQLIATRNTKADAEAFQDAFIVEAIEGNGCCCGGGMSEDQINVVVELGKSSDDPEGRFAKVAAWLDARPDVQGWEAGPVFDLWHGDAAANEATALISEQHARWQRRHRGDV